MRISYIINQYPKVSHTFIRREILALERLGYDVQRISIRGWNENPIDAQDILEQANTQYVLKKGALALLFAAIKVFFANPIIFFKTLFLAIKLSNKADRPLIFHLIYFAEACQSSLWVKQFNAHHIHAHFGTNPCEVAMLTSALCATPYSFTVHGPEEFDKPQFLKLKEKVANCKFVVTVSSFGKSQLQRWVDHNQWDKIKVVHCGLEPSFYQTNTVPLPVDPILICVGRLCEQKGQLLLIEAAKNLMQAQIDFKLVLAGDGEMRVEIESLINKYALQKYVSITGWISSDSVKEKLLNAQIMVLPSFAEGLPVVIMEAMSLRRPVISTYVAGIPELVKHNENGWLCPAGDVEALTQTIKNAIETPKNELQKMGNAAFGQVILRHNIEIEVAKLAHFINTPHLKKA